MHTSKRSSAPIHGVPNTEAVGAGSARRTFMRAYTCPRARVRDVLLPQVPIKGIAGMLPVTRVGRKQRASAPASRCAPRSSRPTAATARRPPSQLRSTRARLRAVHRYSSLQCQCQLHSHQEWNRPAPRHTPPCCTTRQDEQPRVTRCARDEGVGGGGRGPVSEGRGARGVDSAQRASLVGWKGTSRGQHASAR